jgi:hypothetical protein
VDTTDWVDTDLLDGIELVPLLNAKSFVWYQYFAHSEVLLRKSNSQSWI